MRPLARSVCWVTLIGSAAPSHVHAHLVVGRDGSITQPVPFDTVAWHAGRSSYKGPPGVNHFSIGIEMDGPGRMKESRPGYVKSWFNTEYSIAEHEIAYVSTPDHGSGWWIPFTSLIRSLLSSIKY